MEVHTVIEMNIHAGTDTAFVRQRSHYKAMCNKRKWRPDEKAYSAVEGDSKDKNQEQTSRQDCKGVSHVSTAVTGPAGTE